MEHKCHGRFSFVFEGGDINFKVFFFFFRMEFITSVNLTNVALAVTFVTWRFLHKAPENVMKKSLTNWISG